METIHTIGRRKASVARIYLNKGKGAITINKKDYKDFFPVEGLQKKVLQPFSILDLEGKFDVKVNVNGGGNTGMLDKLSKTNIIHKNKAANIKSKLTKHVNSLVKAKSAKSAPKAK